MSVLPSYHKNGRTFGPNGKGAIRGLKFREIHLLIFLFVTFSFAWCLLVLYMPEMQTTDTSFEATYKKFIHRSPSGIDTSREDTELNSEGGAYTKTSHETSDSIATEGQLNSDSQRPNFENGAEGNQPVAGQPPMIRRPKLNLENGAEGNQPVTAGQPPMIQRPKLNLENGAEGNQPVTAGQPPLIQRPKLNLENGAEGNQPVTAGRPPMIRRPEFNQENGPQSKEDWNEPNREGNDPETDDDDDEQQHNRDVHDIDQIGQATERRDKVKEMIKHAWDGYAKYAFGDNELKPISKRGHSAAIFGKTRLGATLVDSLDTLYIAGLYDEFNQGRDWVKDNFNIDQVDSFVSFFEFNIRFIGGFLSAYALSGEEIFKDKAVYLANKMLPVFNTSKGLPSSFVNLKTGAIKNWGWAKGSSVLSEIGTLHLEFQYLTHITGKQIYLKKVEHVREAIKGIPLKDGLYQNLINQNTGQWSSRTVSLGALGDSFYEYLIKSWLITSKHDIEARDMFYDAIDEIESKVLRKHPGGLLMVTDYKNGRSDGVMQHLACFSGGLFALASCHATNGKAGHYMDIAKNITHTCHQSYSRTATKLGPEGFRVLNAGSFTSRPNEKHYLLRPETVESYFYLWRLTHDPKYREWGWEFVQALEANCRVENGYSGIKDVYKSPPNKDDVQQSFFIAETLKYLYLLFSDDSDISLDNWVFNTEAHPLPVLPGIPTNSKF